MIAVAGCSSQAESVTESPETVIENVLTTQINGPSQEMKEMLAPENAEVIGSSEDQQTDLEAYLEETYQPYFTNNMFVTFAGAYALAYLAPAVSNGFELQVESLKVEQQDESHVYDFTVQVTYEKDEVSGVTDVTGTVHMNKSGRISKMTYDQHELPELLQTP